MNVRKATVSLNLNDAEKSIKLYLYIFIIGLVLSGITAFPLESELALLDSLIGEGTGFSAYLPDISLWVSRVYEGLSETNKKYPFIAYGTDWLAFAHLVLAILFIGPLRDPVKNIWVVEFGIICCLLLIPCALICGSVRSIPYFWRFIDCCFGIFGLIPLFLAWKKIKFIERTAMEKVLTGL